MVERADAKAQNDASLALWGPVVTCCFWNSDEVVAISVGRGWLTSQELRLWTPEFESWLRSLPALWVRYSTSLFLSFPICKNGI